MIAENMNFPKALIIPCLIGNRKDLVKRPNDMSLSNNKMKKKLNFKIKSISNQMFNRIK